MDTGTSTARPWAGMTPAPRRAGWAVSVREYGAGGDLISHDLQADGMTEQEAAELGREWRQIATSTGRALEVDVFQVTAE